MKIGDIDTQDISVVVQGAVDGRCTLQCLNSIRKHLPDAEIILSTWKGTNTADLSFDRVVFSEDPGAAITSTKFNAYNNVNRQLVSTQEGLKSCKRRYALKIRSDVSLTTGDFLSYFYKFPCRCDPFKLFEQRIIAISLFSRKYFGIPMPFRVSDWVSFGLTEDIQKYFFNIDAVKEPEFSLYFQNRGQEIPEQFPSKFYYHRFSTEQYYCLSCFQKFFPEIKMKHQFDFNETNIRQSDVALANNFIFLDSRQHGIHLLKKCTWTKWSFDEAKASDSNWDGFYRHHIFLQDYKKYCDHDFKLPLFDWQNMKRSVSNKIRVFFKWSIRPIFIVWCAVKVIRPVFTILSSLKLLFKIIFLSIENINRRMLK